MTSQKSKPKNSYQKYLENKHHQLITPKTILNKFVKKATGSAILSKQKLILGEVNEVYDVTTEDDQNVIIRISRGKYSRFEAEKWAIDASRKKRVPVPKVLLIDSDKLNEKIVYVCVESKIEGEQLRSLITSNKISNEKIRTLIKEEGLILAKIHSVKTRGFGPIDKNGVGKYKTWQDFILKYADKLLKIKKAVMKTDVNPKLIDKSQMILSDHKKLYALRSPGLIHGDYGAKHILVKDNKINGVLDFENARSGDPIFDFAWRFYFPKEPMELLKEGYSDKKIFDKNYETKLYLYGLHLGLGIIKYYIKEKNQTGINHAKNKLKQNIKYFEGNRKVDKE